MKKLLLVACVLSCTLLAKAKDWTQYVNPLMGSQSTFELSTGNTYPAIARPWGMNFWTPQTGKMGDGWQYTYTANKIRGFTSAQSVDQRLWPVLHYADSRQAGV